MDTAHWKMGFEKVRTTFYSMPFTPIAPRPASVGTVLLAECVQI